MKKTFFVLFAALLFCSAGFAGQEVLDGIEVQGSPAFITRTREAFVLLRKSPTFQTIKKHIAIIKEGEHSGMHAQLARPTYEVGAATWKHSAMWFAGSIAHDGYHSQLYKEGKPWTGKQAEIECLKIQAQALKEMGADKGTIEYVVNLQANPTYQGEGTMEDYKKRTW